MPLTSPLGSQGSPGEEGVDGLDGEQVQQVSHPLFLPLLVWHLYSLFIHFTVSLEIFNMHAQRLKLIYVFALICKIEGS